jgi:hypothetical protein
MISVTAHTSGKGRGAWAASTRHRTRLVPVALAGALVLGACGADDDPGVADGDTVPPAADGDLRAPVAVRTAGGSSGGGAPAAAEMADSRMATDMMMPYLITNFVVGDGMPALPTNDTGYLFEIGQAVTAEQVAALAGPLGVAGDPVRVDDGYSTYWRVGPDDGSAPSLYVYEDAQLSWNYSAAWSDTAVFGGCAEPGVAEPGIAVDPVEGEAAPPPDTADRMMVDECAQPEPPSGVPTAADAEARTRALLEGDGARPRRLHLRAVRRRVVRQRERGRAARRPVRRPAHRRGLRCRGARSSTPAGSSPSPCRWVRTR